MVTNHRGHLRGALVGCVFVGCLAGCSAEADFSAAHSGIESQAVASTPAPETHSPASGTMAGVPGPLEPAAAAAADLAFDMETFRQPGRRYAPAVRWLWPGGAVDAAVIAAQVRVLAEAGYGTIEVQPIAIGLGPQEYARDPTIRTVGEPRFFEHVRVLAREAHQAGLAYDLTLGSGWPSGGVGVPPDATERQIIWERVDVVGPKRIVLALPSATEPSWVRESNSLLPGIQIAAEFDAAAKLEAVVAAELVAAAADPPVLGAVLDVTHAVVDGALHWDVPAGSYAVFAFYQNRTSHIVLRGAYSGREQDARVVDHLDRKGSRWLSDHQVATWLEALGTDRPQQLFVDSFELTGELPWSAELGTRYQERTAHSPYVDMPFFLRAGSETKYVDLPRGYSHPAFAARQTEHGQRVREDYERIRAEAFAANFVQPLAADIRQHGVGLRMQAYGGWGTVLDDWQSVDVPESEGVYAGGSFDSLTLAASAAHVAGRALVSTEAFSGFNLAAQALDENGLWELLNLAFSAGINRPVHSTVAYPYVLADGRRWVPFPEIIPADIQPGTAAWSFLPDFNRAQARLGYALRCGTPHTDVAWLMTAREIRDKVQIGVGPLGAHAPESTLSSALRKASYTYDRISQQMLVHARFGAGTVHVGAATYRAIVVDEARVVDDGVLEQLEAAAASGVAIVWVGEAPARAFGAVDAVTRDARIAASWLRLRQHVRLSDAAAVGAVLRAAAVIPEVEVLSPLETIGLVQRDTQNGPVVGFFNESVLPQTVRVTIQGRFTAAVWFDVLSGSESPVVLQPATRSETMTLTLQGRRGGILFLQR